MGREVCGRAAPTSGRNPTQPRRKEAWYARVWTLTGGLKHPARGAYGRVSVSAACGPGNRGGGEADAQEGAAPFLGALGSLCGLGVCRWMELPLLRGFRDLFELPLLLQTGLKATIGLCHWPSYAFLSLIRRTGHSMMTLRIARRCRCDRRGREGKRQSSCSAKPCDALMPPGLTCTSASTFRRRSSASAALRACSAARAVTAACSAARRCSSACSAIRICGDHLGGWSAASKKCAAVWRTARQQGELHDLQQASYPSTNGHLCCSVHAANGHAVCNAKLRAGHFTMAS